MPLHLDEASINAVVNISTTEAVDKQKKRRDEATWCVGIAQEH